MTSPVSVSDAPGLTAGTTANTSPSLLSPSSRSPSLTPPPDEPKPKGKRASAAKAAPKPAKRKSVADETPKKKAKVEEEKAEKGTYCHMCRTKVEPEDVLRCTRLRKYTKHAPPRACNLAWCERDLEKRYEVVPAQIRKRGLNVPADELEKHDFEIRDYVFSCPCCLDECQNATCRTKKGLPRLGDVVKLATEQGISPLEFVRRADAAGHGAESALTDGDTPAKKKTKATPKKAEQTKSGKKATPKKDGKAKDTKAAKTAAAKGKAKTPVKAAAKGKDAKGAKKDTKATTKAAAAKEAKQAEEAKKKVKKAVDLPPVEAPIFNLVNAKFTFEEIENRLYLREFVNRFRGLLGIPDRSISHLEDFDHPLSEASVRQVAGGLLDLIVQDEGRSTGVDYEDIEMISDKREELRHYADLARFAQVYKEIAEPLNLVLPPAESQKERNDRAVRALLDLGENDPAPTWALETGPSRRAAASRLPAPSEVVRMLIAITDHVIHLDAVRFTMDPAVLNTYNDFVRKNTAYNKEENARWEAEKKQLNATIVRSKSAEQTRANKAKFTAAQAEHYLRLRAGHVTLNIVAARKQTRFAPLGTDPDGRVYYALTPRLIDEERYRPSGWTRGIMVWGRGIEAQAATDELPTAVPRWSHISTAAAVRQLERWINRRFLIAVEESEDAANEKPIKKKGFWKVEPKTPKKKARNDDSDAESDLSDAPETKEDLLALLDPPGYVPSAEKIKEDLLHLSTGIGQVATLLEVLEFKGYGDAR